MSRKPLIAVILSSFLLAAFTGCGTTFTAFTVPNGDTFAMAPGPAMAAQAPGGTTFFPLVFPPGYHPNPQSPVATIPVIIVH